MFVNWVTGTLIQFNNVSVYYILYNTNTIVLYHR